MLKNAFVPYTDETGPRISSMRAMSSIAMNESKPRPANEPHDSFTLAPSTSTRMRVLKSLGSDNPRMPMPSTMRVSTVYTPATAASASATVR